MLSNRMRYAVIALSLLLLVALVPSLGRGIF